MSFDIDGFGSSGTTPVDISDVDELGDQNDPEGFDTFEVEIESSESDEDLESITLLNDGNQVATATAPIPEDSDDLDAGKFVVEVSSP